ncbi:acetyltransferase, GNAT family [Bifidobacterium lemurum]|uniref:Acetyltransferase, GNAT family n=1 Tax=Bifidobacterium lemurum TaxID=1603886 RepID=A0A261FMB0_9BIFI|nr:GNAT family N-acetyltransferase [Bifidobacterium lemurum]OZG60103.1 acetyltransferase, GNAT family [Bifidobacterium lemurum]QOL34048.1 GNAT family N-acetyltransferase [Bifidobacterium lemurum]
MLETERLELRRWRKGNLEEAATLFRYASDEEIGPLCGWNPHTGVEESRNIINDVFVGPENYAIALKSTDEPIGCVELKDISDEHTTEPVREAIRANRLLDGCEMDEGALYELTAGSAKELGYWIARPYWGWGFMTEALREMLRHAFKNLGAPAVWGGHYIDNIASSRVMEHCGLKPVCVASHCHFPIIDEYHDCLIRVITRAQWCETLA